MVWPSSCSSPSRSQSASRLVEEQHARAVEDGPGHHEPLGHAAGQGVDRGLGPPAELELLQELVRGLPGGLGAHAEQPAVEVQVLPDGELAVQGVLLGDDPAELLGQRGVGRDVDAGDERPARGRDHAGGEDAGRGGLAGAVRAEEAEDLTGADVEVELVHRGEVRALVDLGQVHGVDDGVRVGRFCCAHRPPSLGAGAAPAGAVVCGVPPDPHESGALMARAIRAPHPCAGRAARV
jgi:hypothetical protein